LEVLRFEETDIKDEFMVLGVKGMLNLKALELSACEGISGPGLFSFLHARGKGFQLTLSACPHIPEDILRALSKVVTLKI
jgi:hypothetical protein